MGVAARIGHRLAGIELLLNRSPEQLDQLCRKPPTGDSGEILDLPEERANILVCVTRHKRAETYISTKPKISCKESPTVRAGSSSS